MSMSVSMSVLMPRLNNKKQRNWEEAYLGFLLSRAVMSPLASSDSLFHTAGFTFKSPYERENGSGEKEPVLKRVQVRKKRMVDSSNNQKQ